MSTLPVASAVEGLNVIAPLRLRRCLLAGLSAVPLVFAAMGAVGAARAESPRRAAAVTVFSDKFSGPAGAAVNASKWTVESNRPTYNHELQYYTAGTANAALDGQGHLVITARRQNPADYQCWYGACQYTSARLNTEGKLTAQYGHIEARMKLPRGQRMWPAFWMLGTPVNWPDSGEIDIMENVGYEPSTVHGTIHGPGYSGANGISGAWRARDRHGCSCRPRGPGKGHSRTARTGSRWPACA